MTSVPHCVGFIVDGNRRWAKKEGVTSLEGHYAGLQNMLTILRHAHTQGVSHVALYLFSTENWNRAKEEVSYLMELIRQVAKEELDTLIAEGVRVHILGQKERFPADIKKIYDDAEEKSRHNQKHLWLCLSYGGRAEIAHAAAQAAKAGTVTEASIAQNLWSAGMPDPDIIVRTGGEQRLSGFLTWQSIYSELFFIPEFWPDLTTQKFDQILEEFSARQRRFGK